MENEHTLVILERLEEIRLAIDSLERKQRESFDRHRAYIIERASLLAYILSTDKESTFEDQWVEDFTRMFNIDLSLENETEAI
jgi:hypothetical protein